MEKKSLRVSALILLIVIGIVLVILLIDKKPSVREDALKFKEEYEIINDTSNVKLDISKDNPIVYLNTFEDLDNKIKNKDSFILYLGYPECPWCRNIIPVLFEVVNEIKINEVYYINVRKMKNNTEDYQKLYNLIYNYLEAKDGKKVLYVPDVYFFKDGNIVEHHLGSVDSQINPSVTLSVEQINELKDIYVNLINKIK